jgi:dihydroorotate dehydrogenase (fumarate)
VAEEVSVPIAVKISPYYSSVASFVVGLQHAGAAGVVVFNRFYSPDLDLETLEVAPRIALSTPEELRLPLRWIGILREHLTMSIAGSTGVHSGFDVAKLILVGADVAMSTSALLHHGTGHLATMTAQLCDWMDEHDYDSVAQMRGAVASHAAADPAAFERANYIGNISTYTSRFIGTGDVPLARHRPE